MPEPRKVFLDSVPALADAIDAWMAEPVIAVDTESDSFFAYRDRVCLVQVSTREADFIIDPLAVNLAPFGALLASTAVEKVFHAADGDILSLKRDYSFSFARLYDTSIAAKACGFKRIGLTNLVEELLGTKLVKHEQRSDWSRRPLSPAQIDYAYGDTRYLLALADRLKLEVAAKGPDVEEEVAHDCERVTTREPRPREVDPESFERFTGARAMPPVSRQVLRALFATRESISQASNKAPFRVVGEQQLGAIALQLPRTRPELQKIPGVSSYIVARHGEALLEAVRVGLAAGPLPYVAKKGPPPDKHEEARFDALRKWRRVVADARGVEVDVICGNPTLKLIARAAPTTLEELARVPEVDPLRVRRYGEAMMATMRRLLTPPPAQTTLTGL